MADASLAHTGAEGSGELGLVATGLIGVGLTAFGAARYSRRRTETAGQADRTS
ncbi:hypothetical protein QMK19_34585 [Streptomyces sp. H10-C2]|uniref:hypothetical protein n=1 Tax=unclassified Streptomyces TaxID=2593676 RepID=UPI0024B95295|nr:MULTISPECIES: hypothetical protein [unclassified Streptomyces]MDJ0346706.1 hypothetical protein [Streptomyces sp. PH10-H1]MDJ0374614.1 hypothetical protein [Streptomyces sp. H10-C2]